MEDLQIKQAQFLPHKQLRRVFGNGLIDKEKIIRELLHGNRTFRFYSKDVSSEIAYEINGLVRFDKHQKSYEVIP
jgi:hypothetical protein